jgi:phosphatidylserine/phosphatidylglycerophosphate/cardiolipin synthase-like enzyme
MNARSFGQDTENGLIFLDRAMAARLGALAETYRQRARRIDAPLPLTPLERTLAAIPAIRPLF